MNIFLGEPPANIKAWIIEHYNPSPAGSANTIFTFSGGQTVSLNISGILESIWTYDEDSDSDILNYEGSDKLLKSDLVSVNIGNTVTSIDGEVFEYCGNLTSFSVSAGNVNFQSVNGLLLTKDGNTLVHGANGDIVIPDCVTSIKDKAFLGHSGLTSVSIPNSVTSIGAMVFQDCLNMTSVTINKTKSQVESMEDKYWGLGLVFDEETGVPFDIKVTIHCNDNQDIIINPES